MLLSLAAECGYEVAALEIRDQVADALRRIGIDVLSHRCQDLVHGPAGEYDISLCDVFNTLQSPCRCLMP